MSSKLNAFQRAIQFTGMEKGFGHIFAIVAAGFAVGAVVDRSDTNSMTFYRDRSALYGRELKDGERPSWPTKENFFT